MEQKTSGIRVSSNHFIQQIESAIIQLTRCLAAEYQIQPDPDAKNIARKMIQDRVNQLLNKEEIEGVRLLKKAMKEAPSLYSRPIVDIVEAMYEVLKMMGLDNV